jgi:hypothetical protein
MAYDLDNLVNRLDLLHLDESFTQEEIDSVIKEIPTMVSLLSRWISSNLPMISM